MNSANLDDVDLEYSDQGEGPVLVLLHGFPLNHSMWKYQIEEFCTTHRVIAPDLRGHGRSPVTPGTVSMAEMARDVARLLDHLHIDEPVSLAGLSMGGYVAWEFWLQFRNRLQNLLLFDTRAQADTEEVARGRNMMAAQVVADGASMIADYHGPQTRFAKNVGAATSTGRRTSRHDSIHQRGSHRSHAARHGRAT